MRRPLKWWPRDRRQTQSGATLIELLVSVTIMGLALTLIIGTFSTGLLQATMSKRNVAATAVTEYELDKIIGAAYDSTPTSYSDCFATESTPPLKKANGNYRGNCPAGSTLRADVSWNPGPNNTQQWSITINSWPASAQIGGVVQTIKMNRRDQP
jgi:type II secretory pathway pseudopilin PulG